MADTLTNKSISFNMPNPYQADLAKIQEQQQLAQLLQQQSMQAPERFSYKGIEARTSPLTGIAKALQGFAAEKMRIDARNEEKALGERYRADRSSDLQTLVEALGAREGRASLPTEYPSSGTAGGGEAMGLPAVTAKPAGVLDPSVLSTGVFKTPDIENMAVQQYLSQLAPKAPIKVGAGETLVNPSTFAEVYKAPKEDYGQPIREQLPDGRIVTVAYDKSGNRRVIETGGAQPAVSADTAARLQQEREISDRAFNSLSENQRRQLQNEAARLGISAKELFFNTGLSVGVPEARSSMTPAVAPAPVAPATVAPVTPAAPLPTPARAPSLVPPPVGASPAQTAASAPATMAGMTPKTQQQVLADQFKAQYAPLPEAAAKQIVGARNLSQAVDEYQKALNNWSNYKMYDPNARAEMGRVYNNMMLQAKEAYNLGVLNGPDYDILTSIVADPTKPMSAFLTNQTLKNQAEGLKQTAKSIEKTSREVHDRSSKGGAAPTSTSGAKFLGFE